MEVDQPLLLQAILDIAFYGSAAHEKRQSDVYRSIKTLDELTKQLNDDGFNIHRGGVYLHLIPKRSSSLEGKRHVTTVPVKLIRAQNDSHAKHVDQKFCLSTIKHLEEISSTLGPNEVCFISQDDKARVPIGLTAANKQSPLLMHVEYRVSLPDHDWVVAAQHKLIPSVYAGIVVQPNGLGKPEAISYSGPTYIAIRSGKHSSSTAYAHALDFERLLQLPEFDTITKYGPDKVVKPVIVITVDGGPDENPRYQKVIETAVHHFVQKNLDAYFIATNAPGRSAFNRVERRMAPLSRELSGLILPHDKYGSQLNDRGLTIDTNLEKKNFSFAGSTLAEIWSQTVIDGHPIVAEYIDPELSELKPESLQSKDPIWFAAHVRTSQYFTQIVKCNNTCCCSKPRSSYFTFMPERFLAPPIPIVQTPLDGLKAPERNVHEQNHRFPSLFVSKSLDLDEILPRSTKAFKVLPYDLYCPSVHSQLLDRSCNICFLYFASKVMLHKHMVVHKKAPVEATPKRDRPIKVAARRQRELMAIIAYEENRLEQADWIDEDFLDLEGVLVPPEIRTETAMNVCLLEEHFRCPWVEDAGEDA